MFCGKVFAHLPGLPPVTLPLFLLRGLLGDVYKRQDYESAYQGRIDGLMQDLLDRKEFSYSYGADPLYRQYAQLYTQNAQNRCV